MEKNEFDIKKIILKYKPVITFKVRKALWFQTPDWEDIVDEIIINVVEKLKKGEFRGDSSISTFIYTITSRRIADFIRKKTKVLRCAPEPDPIVQPYEEIEKKEKIELIAKAITKLKPKYREALYFYYYKGLSREEAAKRLGIAPCQLSNRVNYAQKLLKKIINE